MLNMKSLEQVKRDLREEVLCQLKQQEPKLRVSKSLKIKELVIRSPFFRRAQTVLFYLATGFEVETKDLIEESINLGKTVALPVCEPKTREILPVRVKDLSGLTRGSTGILEPVSTPDSLVPLSAIDLVLVPGVAFDRWGHRLGRGLGYYDRFLAKLRPTTVKVGLAFDFQVIENIPAVEGRDIPLDLVLSN